MTAERRPSVGGGVDEPPPPMAPHTAGEFAFARKTLQRMVLDSRFFPPKAHHPGWFRPRDVAGGDGEAGDAGEEPAPSAGGTSTADDAVAQGASTADEAVADSAEAAAGGGPVAFPAADDGTKSASFLCSVSQDAAHLCRVAGEGTGTATPAAEDIAALARDSSRDAEVAPVPSVREGEIDYGEVLGKGGFCEVRLAALRDDRRGGADGRGPRLYAMKYLSPSKYAPQAEELPDKPRPRNKAFERGIADLAIEARFLTLLSHDNIIKLHYVSGGSLEEQFNCRGGDYRHRFGLVMLLDPMHETLAKRIDDTYIPRVFCGPAPPTPAAASSRGLWRRLTTKKRSDGALPLEGWRIQLARRLEGLRGVAAAMQYLHDDCRVIYRDCKPDNIGFYRRRRGDGTHVDVPKIFDFGLAKELKPKLLKAHPHHETGRPEDTYRLTPRSGSRRYMAPEVAFSTPYNEKADVFSFGILLYQVASLVTPFEGYSLYRHEKEVLCDGARPDLRIPAGRRDLRRARRGAGLDYVEWRDQRDRERQVRQLEACTKCVWTPDLRRLIEECWHDDLRERPAMRQVVARLEDCIEELTPEGLRKSLMQETLTSDDLS